VVTLDVIPVLRRTPKHRKVIFPHFGSSHHAMPHRSRNGSNGPQTVSANSGGPTHNTEERSSGGLSSQKKGGSAKEETRPLAVSGSPIYQDNRLNGGPELNKRNIFLCSAQSLDQYSIHVSGC
jgi:hypothetical protein